VRHTACTTEKKHGKKRAFSKEGRAQQVGAYCCCLQHQVLPSSQPLRQPAAGLV
jgi:hypothetical protein